jgi:hypothetical protein
MKWQEANSLFHQIKEEAGNPKVELVSEKDASMCGQKRLAGEPYRIVKELPIGEGIGIMVKFRDRSEKVVARYIHQAIAEILWPNIPYWKHRWHGLVMSQPDEFPKDVKLPDPNAHSRSRELQLTRQQTNRKFGGQ